MEYTYVWFLLGYMVLTASSNYVPHQWHDTVCLSCTGVARLADCRTVQRCSQQQQCYVERVIPGAHHFNRPVYNLGCVTNQHSSWTSHGGFPVCTYRCQGKLCNQYGCGLRGYSVGRGPICYSCPNEPTRTSCTTISVCWPTQSCAMRRRSRAGAGNISYSTSCEFKKMCRYAPVHTDGLHQPVIGRRHNAVQRRGRSPDECLQCCADDMCNDMECVKPTTTTIATTTTTVATTTGHIWGQWMAWSSCSASCDRGNQARVRTCQSGNACPGSSVDVRACNVQTCPTSSIDGQWGSWGAWHSCTTTCGLGGYQRRFRHCDSPNPQHGGHRCPGNIYDTQKCNVILCCTGPPVITHLDANVSVTAGSIVVLQCSATGLDSMIWEGPKVVGKAFPSNVNILPNGHTLLISGLTAENTGVYRCVTKNQCGTVSKSTTVSIH